MNSLDCTIHFHKQPFFYWLRLLTCLVRTHFLLLAWYGSMLLFWSRSARANWSYLSFPPKGRDTSLPFLLALFFSSSPRYSLGQINLSPTSPSPSYSFAQINLSPIPLLPSLATWTSNLSPFPLPCLPVRTKF